MGAGNITFFLSLAVAQLLGPVLLQVPVHNVHDTHVHNGTFITHSPYGLHAAEDTEAAFASPHFAPPEPAPRGPICLLFFSIFERHQEQSGPQGLVAQTP